MTFSPTPEQQAILDFACSSNSNLMISALAGAAKTTTLEMLSRALPIQPTLCLAFNKRIATAMQERLPGHVRCQTLNALGHQVWSKTVPKRLSLETGKTYGILKNLVEALPRAEKAETYEYFADIMKAVGAAKLAGYIPESAGLPQQGLITAAELWEDIDDLDLRNLAEDLVDAALVESIRQSYAGTIDFDDQIYMSCLFGGTFPKFALVMVDETQDLSSINHEMIAKLVKHGTRLIAVGDPYQSIYGFRGAVTSGMAAMRERFSMVEMPLSISFRCPRLIVERARSRAPMMQAPEWAEDGLIASFTDPAKEESYWTAGLIPDGAAIICRNNAPLYSMAFKLIRAGRGVTIVGSDIGPALVKALKKLSSDDLDKDAAHAAINEWEKDKLKKNKRQAATRDKADCLRVFVDIGGSLAGAIAYAESLFKTKGPIQLLSGHKSKGLEWDHVFHLDPHRVPSPYAHGDAAIEQELNVRYVIETRPKKSLTLISMETYNG